MTEILLIELLDESAPERRMATGSLVGPESRTGSPGACRFDHLATDAAAPAGPGAVG